MTRTSLLPAKDVAAATQAALLGRVHKTSHDQEKRLPCANASLWRSVLEKVEYLVARNPACAVAFL